jgi:hypothetical protein
MQDDPLLMAQMEDWRWMDELRNEGKLDAYRGEYVFAANRLILGHGRDLFALRPVVEAKAAEQGISPERIIDYFMPGDQ